MSKMERKGGRGRGVWSRGGGSGRRGMREKRGVCWRRGRGCEG